MLTTAKLRVMGAICMKMTLSWMMPCKAGTGIKT